MYILNHFSPSIHWNGNASFEIPVKCTLINAGVFYKILTVNSTSSTQGYSFTITKNGVSLTISIAFGYDSTNQLLTINSVQGSSSYGGYSGSGVFCPGKYATGVDNEQQPLGLKFYNNQILPNSGACSVFYTQCFGTPPGPGINTNEIYGGGNLEPWPDTIDGKKSFSIDNGTIEVVMTLQAGTLPVVYNLLFPLTGLTIPVDGQFHSYLVSITLSISGIHSETMTLPLNLRLFSSGKLDYQLLDVFDIDSSLLVAEESSNTFSLNGLVTTGYTPYILQSNTKINGDLYVTGSLYVEEA